MRTGVVPGTAIFLPLLLCLAAANSGVPDVGLAVSIRKGILQSWSRFGLVSFDDAWLGQDADRSIAVVLARLGDFEIAHEIARKSGDWALVDVAARQAESGDVEGALRLAESLEGPYARASALRLIGTVLMRSGNAAEALELLEGRASPRRRECLAHMAHDAAVSGDASGARAVLDLLAADRYDPTQGLSSDDMLLVAEAYGHTGDMARAQASMDKVALVTRPAQAPESEIAFANRLGLMRRLALLCARLGEERQAQATFSRAISTATSTELEPVRFQRVTGSEPMDAREAARLAAEEVARVRRNEIASIALAQAKSGYIEDALDTARILEPDQGVPPRRLFGVVFNSSDHPPTEREFQALRFRKQQCEVTVQIQLIADDIAGALETCEDYLQWDDGDELLWSLMVKMAVRQAEQGYLEDALRTASTIPDETSRAEALLSVSQQIAATGDQSRAVGIAAGIAFPTMSPFLRSRKAVRFAWQEPDTWGLEYQYFPAGGGPGQGLRSRSGLASAAMRFEQTIGVPEGRDYAAAFQDFEPAVLRALARAHGETGDPEEALEWCLKIEKPKRRLAALIGLTEGLTGDSIVSADSSGAL